MRLRFPLPARVARPLVAAWALSLALPFWAGAQSQQQPLSALQIDVDAVTRGARSSVVSVFAQRVAPDARKAGSNTTPRILTRVGSGVAVTDDRILTTASVVLGAEKVLVRASNGIEAEAEIVGLDEVFNLALLRVSAMRLPPLRFAEQRPTQVGDWVIALGTSYRAQHTQSVGYVAFRYREPRTALLQTTNTVYPGNSGGAALNAFGDLIGIIQGELGPAQSPLSDTPPPPGVSFVMPIEVVRPVYNSLNRFGRMPHGYLGVSTSAASVAGSVPDSPDVPLGARVERVVPGGPGDQCGLQAGDLIVGFDLDRVEYPEQLARWVSTSRPGSAVRLVWLRGEHQMSGKVLLTESPYAAPQWAVTPSQRGSDPSAERIADLQRQIQKLSHELDDMRGASAPPPRR